MKELYLYLMFVLFVCHECHADTNGKEARSKAMNYFLKYGYIDWYPGNIPAKMMAMVVKRFQYFSNLKVTGSLDDATLKQMDLPRCGISDPHVHTVKDAREEKGYLAQGFTWDMSNNKKRELTWRVVAGGRRITREQTRRVMYQALGIWEKHTNLHFREVSASSKVDIIVKYGRLCHGDRYCFDYKGGTLAHAFYPYPGQAMSGDVHFDDDEDFSVGGKPGTDLLWVAVHALGHSLGLEHTHIKGSIMYPWPPQGFKADPDLVKGDIQGIQHLYGSPVAQPKTKRRP